MKNLLFTVIISLIANYAFANKIIKRDTVFYLLDTTNWAVKDRMWVEGIEGKFRYYILQCPCLQYEAKPTFICRTEEAGEIVSNDFLTDHTLVSLPDLIVKTKKYLKSSNKNSTVFFIVEHINGSYLKRRVGLITPEKQFIAN